MEKKVIELRSAFVDIGSLMVGGNAIITLSNGQVMKTSKVLTYFVGMKGVSIETKNSIYLIQ